MWADDLVIATDRQRVEGFAASLPQRVEKRWCLKRNRNGISPPWFAVAYKRPVLAKEPSLETRAAIQVVVLSPH